MVAYNVALSKNILKDMKSWSNTNVDIRLMKNHNDTFMLHKLTEDLSTAHAFSMGSFFNKQSSGIKLVDFNRDSILGDIFQIVATYKGSGMAEYNITMGEKRNTTEL